MPNVAATSALLAKMAEEIVRINSKQRNQDVITFVNTPGVYTDVRGNSVFLNSGDIWKCGETTNEIYAQLRTMVPGGAFKVIFLKEPGISKGP